MNRDWTDTSYTFGLVTYENDRFNGLYNNVTTSLGYGHRLFSNDTQYFDTEIGPGWRYNQSSDNANEGIFRVAFDYDWKISASAAFHQTFASEIGSNNTMTRAESALTNNIWGPLALKTSITLTHQTHPAQDSDDDAPEHLDTVTAITLLYAF